jgi:cell division protein FtsB
VKTLILFFVALIALLQYPLWLGQGSWKSVWQLNQKVEEQTRNNQILKSRNEALDAEVRDLKSGQDAIEERARSELGMLKNDEVFYQVLDQAIMLQKLVPNAKTDRNLDHEPSPTEKKSNSKQN